MARLAVVHNITGRLRVRLPADSEPGDLEKHLRAHDGVTSCRYDPRTRSLLIQYGPGEVSLEQLLNQIRSITGAEADPEESADIVPATPLSKVVKGAVSSLNLRISDRTARQLNVRMIVALSLAGWSIGQIVRGRAKPLEWSTAFWYAYELFRHDADASQGDS